MSRTYLRLCLDAPMMSFGAASEGSGVYLPEDAEIASQPSGVPTGVALIPRKSAIVGLIGNALGYERYETAELQSLNDRLRMASGVAAEREPRLLGDFQTAQLGYHDQGWTTRGRVQGRRGHPKTYESPHLMRKAYVAECIGWVALRLESAPGLTLDDVAEALVRPERPLFIGRKACIPSRPILHDRMEAEHGRAALADLPGLIAWAWERGEGPDDAPTIDSDGRHWKRGVYAGGDVVHYELPEDGRWSLGSV